MYKRFVAIIFLFFCMNMSASDSIQNPLSRLEGTWYVNMSNFKMWLKGNKLNPQFNYSTQVNGEVTGLKDVVSYSKNQKIKTIIGFDKPLNTEASKFIWRGKGLLFLFKSKWEIIYETNEWTLIHFEKTIATAEGYDVISRQKNINEEIINSIKIKLRELGINAELTVIKQQ